MNPQPTTTTSALILADGDAAPDVLESVPATTVAGGQLRPGMVLLDPELDSPMFVIDHRIGSAGPRTGAVVYLAEDLEAGGWTKVTRHANAAVKVASR